MVRYSNKLELKIGGERSEGRRLHLEQVQVCGGPLQLNSYVIFFLSLIPLKARHKEKHKHGKTLSCAKKILCLRRVRLAML